MKVKKVIAVVISIVVICGAVAGGIYGYKSYQDKNLVAEVQPVSDINWGYWGDTQTSYGMVTNDSSQEIYLTDSKTVKKVYVEEGDTVSAGDPLIEYDTAELKIEIERKRLDISTIDNEIAIASHVLDVLKVAKPVDKKPPKLDLSILEQLEKEDMLNQMGSEKDERDSRIYNYITESSLPYNMKTDPVTGESVYPAGTEDEPYIYYCNQDAYVYGSFFNFIRPSLDGTPGKYVKFIICLKDADGKMVMTGAGSGDGSTGNGSGDGSTGSGDGSTGNGSGNGSTGSGSGDGSTGNGSGDGSTGNGSGDGSTGSGSGDGSTGSGTGNGTGGTQGTESTGNTENTGYSRSTQNPENTGSTENNGTTGNNGSTENNGSTGNNGSTENNGTTGNIGSSENNGTTGNNGNNGNTGNGSGVSEPVADPGVSPNTASFNGNNIPTDYEYGQMWYVFTGEEYVPISLADQYMDEFLENSGDWKEPEGYTKEEIFKGIIEKQSELKTLDIRKRQQELQLQTLLDTASDGIVYAKVDGVAKTVGDPDEFKKDGTPFLVVTGDDGLFVSGSISELLLGDVTKGTVVTANSWESGMTFEATITEISDYPVSSNSYGEGNPNVSYYAYTAYIEDSSALRNGEYVDLSISTNQSDTGGMYIENAYVRQEDGKSYVMIADENDRLKKQYIVTGKTIYGSSIEIKSGLSEEDRIAFPYGKNAVEGAAVTETSNMYY